MALGFLATGFSALDRRVRNAWLPCRRPLAVLSVCTALWIGTVSPPSAAPAAPDAPAQGTSSAQAPDAAATPGTATGVERTINPAPAEAGTKQPTAGEGKAAPSSADAPAKPKPQKAANPVPARSAAERARQGAERAIRQAEESLAAERRR